MNNRKVVIKYRFVVGSLNSWLTGLLRLISQSRNGVGDGRRRKRLSQVHFIFRTDLFLSVLYGRPVVSKKQRNHDADEI